MQPLKLTGSSKKTLSTSLGCGTGVGSLDRSPMIYGGFVKLLLRSCDFVGANNFCPQRAADRDRNQCSMRRVQALLFRDLSNKPLQTVCQQVVTRDTVVTQRVANCYCRYEFHRSDWLVSSFCLCWLVGTQNLVRSRCTADHTLCNYRFSSCDQF